MSHVMSIYFTRMTSLWVRLATGWCVAFALYGKSWLCKNEATGPLDTDTCNGFNITERYMTQTFHFLLCLIRMGYGFVRQWKMYILDSAPDFWQSA